MNRSQIRSAVRLGVGSLSILALAQAVEGQVSHYACHADQVLQQAVPKNLDHMGHSIAIGDFNHDGI
jgi:hypothetical protein